MDHGDAPIACQACTLSVRAPTEQRGASIEAEQTGPPYWGPCLPEDCLAEPDDAAEAPLLRPRVPRVLTDRPLEELRVDESGRNRRWSCPEREDGGALKLRGVKDASLRIASL